MFSPGPPRDRLELPERFRAGELEIDRAAMRAVLAGRALTLEPKAFDLLLLLAANCGRVVTKDEIFERVWPGVIVSDNSLTRLVAQLRRELGDDPETPRYLETVRTRGYRFLPTPEAVEADATPASAAAAEGDAGLVEDGSRLPDLRGSSPDGHRGARELLPGRRTRTLRIAAASAVAALLVAAAFWLVARTGERSERSFPGALTQLTVDPAFDGQPAISPDGASVVFVSERSGVPELWLRPIVGGEEKPLTSGNGGAVDPVFSPDGRWICYTSLRHGGIWRIPAAGGTPSRLTDFGSRAAFSPDGSRLVFQSQEQVMLGGGQWVASRDSTLWLLEVATGALTPLTRRGSTPGGHGAPRWSPDGSSVVFVSNDWRLSGIWRVPAIGGEPERIAQTAGWLAEPVFDSSGRNLFALRSTPDRGLAVVRVPLAGGRGAPIETVLPAAPPGSSRLALSRDGRRLLLAATETSGAIERIPLGSGGAAAGPPIALFPAESARLMLPLFLRPEGRRVVVRRLRPGAGRWDVLFASRESGVERELRDFGAGIGTWQALLSGEVLLNSGDGVLRTVAVDPVSGRTRPVPEVDVTFARAPRILGGRIAPDLSTFTAAVRQGERFAIVQVPVGRPWAPRTILEDEYVDFPIPSADGARIAFEREVEHRLELWAVEADGSRLRRLAGGAQSWTGGWSPDASRHAFVALRDGAWNVFTVREDGTDEKVLTANRRFSTYYRYPDWSPADDAVVVERTTARGEVWSLTLDSDR
jgi:Tol biopolymer transport system component/DNA-binding winged helix-turn-helix (wHTH) protein